MNVKETKKIHEYLVALQPIDEPVRCRITETLGDGVELPFRWEVGHFYSPGDGRIHYPDATSARTHEEAFQLMTGYLANMKPPLQANKDYGK